MAHATVLLLCAAVMNALSDEPLHSADRCSHAAALANSPCTELACCCRAARLRVWLQALKCGAERNEVVNEKRPAGAVSAGPSSPLGQ